MPDTAIIDRQPHTVDRKSASVGAVRTTRRYVTAAEKGGGGKSTFAVSFAGALAEGSTRTRRGPAHRVLVVDLGVTGGRFTIYDVLMGRAEVRDAIQPAQTPNIDVLPATEDLAGAGLELPTRAGWQTTLRVILDQFGGAYDDIVIDTPPGLGVLPMVGLVAGQYVVVPVPPAFAAVRLVDKLLATVERARTFTPDLAVLGIVPWAVGRPTLHRDEALAEMVKRWPDLVLTRPNAKRPPVGIPERVAFADAAVDGLPITAYLPSSPAAAAVRALTKEITARGPTA
jgi:chromosome partitioning protein